MKRILIFTLLILTSLVGFAQYKTETEIIDDTTTVVYNQTKILKLKNVQYYPDEKHYYKDASVDFYFINDKDSTFTVMVILDENGELVHRSYNKNATLEHYIYKNGNYCYSVYLDDTRIIQIAYLKNKDQMVILTE